jgi:hypothetical protein
MCSSSNDVKYVGDMIITDNDRCVTVDGVIDCTVVVRSFRVQGQGTKRGSIYLISLRYGHATYQ